MRHCCSLSCCAHGDEQSEQALSEQSCPLDLGSSRLAWCSVRGRGMADCFGVKSRLERSRLSDCGKQRVDDCQNLYQLRAGVADQHGGAGQAGSRCWASVSASCAGRTALRTEHSSDDVRCASVQKILSEFRRRASDRGEQLDQPRKDGLADRRCNSKPAFKQAALTSRHQAQKLLDQAVLSQPSNLLGIAGVALRQADETRAGALECALVMMVQQTCKRKPTELVV